MTRACFAVYCLNFCFYSSALDSTIKLIKLMRVIKKKQNHEVYIRFNRRGRHTRTSYHRVVRRIYVNFFRPKIRFPQRKGQRHRSHFTMVNIRAHERHAKIYNVFIVTTQCHIIVWWQFPMQFDMCYYSVCPCFLIYIMYVYTIKRNTYNSICRVF